MCGQEPKRFLPAHFLLCHLHKGSKWAIFAEKFPQMRFDELDFNYDVLDALDAMRFEECTPIQEQSMPLIMEGRDLIAVAQTGTGKTAAYLLPVLDRLSDGDFPEDAVNCIVMSPTRELAMQIDNQLLCDGL